MPKELDELLMERKKLMDLLNKKEDVLGVLDAYKRTLVKALVKNESFFDLASDFRNDENFEIVRIEDEYPFFILNLGTLENLKQSEESTRDTVPVNFRVLRQFNKTDSKDSAGELTWYTSTILKKDDKYYFRIKDDENKIWKGPNAFYDFCKAFNHPIPFKNIEEWFGLDKNVVISLFKQKEYKH